ncbi:MAG: ankyrin repeat domain-containing protein, partial [Proteobacteria bacterium]|nr:ankyrin repeat domain-containing protein [Pseudomonadota bacterium]
MQQASVQAKQPAPMPGDSVPRDKEAKYDTEYPEPRAQPMQLKAAQISEDQAVIEEITLLGLVDPLPDLSQDQKAWTTLQNILHPQPAGVEIEEDFLCPITQSLIRDPVTTVDGQMYEREAIEQWFSEGKTTSPSTNDPLASKTLTPNVFAKKQIHSLIDKNPVLKDSEEWYLPRSWIAEFKTACQVGNEKLIRELISRDRRLLVLTFKESPFTGQTALHIAAAVAHPKALDVVIELLESRQKGLALAALLQPDDEGRLPLHQAVLAKQDAQTLLKLLTRMGKHIAQVLPSPSGWPPGFDRRVLNEALAWYVGQEDPAKILCLLRLGADPQAKTAQGETRVYQAVKQGCAHSLNLLLECKADPNPEDKRLDDSPLHAAVRRGDAGMVTALLKAGAQTSRVLNNGRTPLHLAAERNSDDMLKTLAGELETLPTLLREAQDAEGGTPLHRAAAAGSVIAVAWLLDHNANPQAVNAKGETALHLAARANRTDSIAWLLERGASLSATDHQGNTALHIAAEAGAGETVAALLKAGM